MFQENENHKINFRTKNSISHSRDRFYFSSQEEVQALNNIDNTV